MSENNQEDFNFFATGKRVRKDEPVLKSPLDSGSKWNIQEETQIQPRVASEQPSHIKPETFSNIQPEIRKPVQFKNEEIGNVGSELQKLRRYPQKSYDKFLNKMVTFNEEDFYLIRDLSAEISMARKKSNIANKGTLPRVTENTIIRAALKAMFSKIGNGGIDLNSLQTEEGLESYFNSLLK